jgi:hypothetical protein
LRSWDETTSSSEFHGYESTTQRSTRIRDN